MKIKVGPLEAVDLDEADRIMRLAFGTFNGLDDPLSFMGDGGFVRPRWHTDPQAAFGVKVEGRLAGSNFLADWGSFAFLGPLSIDPAYWGHGLAHHLMRPVMETLERRQITHAGLFTFPHSLKHISLYQKYGFRPRMLTSIFKKKVMPHSFRPPSWSRYAGLDEFERKRILDLCRRLTRTLYDGLDLTAEITSLYRQKLGDTVLLWGKNGDLAGFAVCHSGAGSEGGSRNCYVKFAAAAPGKHVRERFERLLNAVFCFAEQAGAVSLIAGVNSAHRQAYECMLSYGFGLWRTGIAMHRPNQSAFCRSDVFAIDDWR